jgi:hypothetical protein
MFELNSLVLIFLFVKLVSAEPKTIEFKCQFAQIINLECLDSHKIIFSNSIDRLCDNYDQKYCLDDKIYKNVSAKCNGRTKCSINLTENSLLLKKCDSKSLLFRKFFYYCVPGNIRLNICFY